MGMANHYENAQTLEIAQRQGRVVQFAYPTGPTRGGRAVTAMKRTVSPYELSNGKVLGWDHDREGLRHFTIDKIIGTVETDPDAEYVHPVT